MMNPLGWHDCLFNNKEERVFLISMCQNQNVNKINDAPSSRWASYTGSTTLSESKQVNYDTVPKKQSKNLSSALLNREFFDEDENGSRYFRIVVSRKNDHFHRFNICSFICFYFNVTSQLLPSSLLLLLAFKNARFPIFVCPLFSVSRVSKQRADVG